jgi:hypothetical protein
MGSPLSLVIKDSYIEDFEGRGLDLATKHLCRFRYVDTFIIWPHRTNKLRDFLNHPNSIHHAFSSPWRLKVRATFLSLT